VTENERIDIVENQLEHIFYLCQSFAEVEDEDSVRALYEEYAEWFEAQNEDEGEYTVMWAPDWTTCTW